MDKLLTLFIVGLFSFGNAQGNDLNKKYVLTIHANISQETAAPTLLRSLKSVTKLAGESKLLSILSEAESVSAGHAWISLRTSDSCTTYGLFGEGTTINKEQKYRTGLIRSKEINLDQFNKLNKAIHKRENYQWTGYYNCASYASEIWNEVTGESINPVPEKSFHYTGLDGDYESKANVYLNPLPPSPLGIVQEIMRYRDGDNHISKEFTVCP
ncbi:hypothetical protein [Endozoicomonas elysicola]|uniref:Uncharacterized protein n=1 Tax=Endozoicomonas elysicola TaxID=305900 RepID=A0A081KDD1_9GAMM|nr:hypothetical protein [Endozoicomonas elysicola]KEI72157.1 hypothetical protein GV64_16765 [Endozoicomonas elysicola]